jgi:RNA polymerase sigma-70 factor (ECF subfamily)
MTGPEPNSAFQVQADVRGPWRRYLDALAPLRPSLHRYCCRLTGNVWDGEDLMQDALLRVFGLLGKIDADLENPRAYFVRTATHLWIDQQRRGARDRAWRSGLPDGDASSPSAEERVELHQAANALLTRLPPRERAAVLMREVLDLSAKESAAVLQMTEGAVKAALHRGRQRLQESHDMDDRPVPSPALVDRFLAALSANDMETMRKICVADLSVELVGGARIDDFETSRTFFGHAHMVFPPEYAHIARAMGLGTNPHWRAVDYRGERIVIGFRTLDGVEGLNEVHRIDELDGKVARIRCYCFSPDTLATVAEDLGVPALRKPYRSP